MIFGFMDVKTLLELVAARRPLWCIAERGDRLQIDTLWKEVGQSMGLSGYITRLKWQNLRDTFRKEVTKWKRARESGEQFEPTWKHFRAMAFLLEVVDKELWLQWKRNHPDYAKTRPGNSSSAGAPSTSTKSAKDLSDQDPLTISNAVSLDLHEGESNQNSCIDIRPEDPIKVEPAEIWDPTMVLPVGERSHMTSGEDEDYHFLMSLLPHLREIPKSRKLIVRQKLQQAIIDELKD